MIIGGSYADDSQESAEVVEDAVVEDDLGKSREASRTDDEVVARYMMQYIIFIVTKAFLINTFVAICYCLCKEYSIRNAITRPLKIL